MRWTLASIPALLALTGCDYLVNSVNTGDFERSLSGLVAASAPGTRLFDCRLFDTDPIAPAGTCLAYANSARVEAISASLGLHPPSTRDTQLSDKGCAAQSRFSRGDTDIRVSWLSNRADFAYVALYFQRASRSLCVEARVAWG